MHVVMHIFHARLLREFNKVKVSVSVSVDVYFTLLLAKSIKNKQYILDHHNQISLNYIV